MTDENQFGDEPIPAEDDTTGQNGGDTATDPAQDELMKWKVMAQRATADLQNFKRRAEEEKSSLRLFANLQFLQAIFPVIDNFQRAFQHIPEDIAENGWVKGLVAIEKNFIETLNSLGLQEIPTLPGTPFDPNLHEVVTQGPGKKDVILECFEKGFMFKEQVVRPAKVQVGDGSA